MKTTFFDYIGVSDMERVHSATLAWMVSDYCKALTIGERVQILNKLFGTKRNDIISIETVPEFEHIDVAFKTIDNCRNEEFWILENKIKAPLGHKQLEEYKKKLDNIKNNAPEKPIGKYFSAISLIGNLPQDKTTGWHLSTYKDLLDVLNSICTSKKIPCRHLEIIQEYKDCISNLVYSLSEFLLNPEKFPDVFTNGSTVKSAKIIKNGINGYIAKNGLETLFQKAYFTKIVNEIISRQKFPFRGCHVSETHGNADFAFYLGSFNNKTDYSFDISFQNGAFKIAVCKNGYPKLSELSSKEKDELTQWRMAFDEVKQNYPQYSKTNKPRSRARISISYNLQSRKWYEYNQEEFIDLVITQILLAIEIATEVTITKYR